MALEETTTEVGSCDCCCPPCPCIGLDVPALCGNFGAYVSGPCPGLYGDQVLNPDFPVDGEGHQTDCFWIGTSSIGCGAWQLGWDCGEYVLSSARGVLTCAAADFSCSTGGTFTNGTDTVTLAPC